MPTTTVAISKETYDMLEEIQLSLEFTPGKKEIVETLIEKKYNESIVEDSKE